MSYLGFHLFKIILLFIIIINEKINVAISQKTARTRNTQKNDDVFGRQRKKQKGQRHQYEVANKHVFTQTPNQNINLKTLIFPALILPK